jgi:hypothetical protein
MPLDLKPNIDGGPADFNVMHGELIVGRLYQRGGAPSVGTEWLWALNGVPFGPPETAITGPAATRDGALTALTERWSKWLDWANLAERAYLMSDG